ncbi:MAG: response regulator [Gammaproteobacteria bacterium]
MLFTTPDILIVEDEALNRELMAARLESTNYSVRFAVNGKDALEKIAEQKPDLVLLDIKMPDMSGLEVLNSLRQIHSMVELPVIMVTAIDEDQRIVRALELGANDYVTKPVNFPVLMARLQTQLCLKQLSSINKEFLATASHDIRKPLGLIMDISSQTLHKLNLNRDDYPSSELIETIQMISQSASYVQNITDCILDMQISGFGQIRLTKVPINIESLINEIIDAYLKRATDKNISLECEEISDKLVIEADRTRIGQVLDNLLSNAIKFCSEGDKISISASSNGEQILVEVKDSGPGLTEEDLENLFQGNVELSNKPTDDETSYGLGLPVCRQMVEIHDGVVGAFNNPDKGATFWFRLPAFKLRSVD